MKGYCGLDARFVQAVKEHPWLSSKTRRGVLTMALDIAHEGPSRLCIYPRQRAKVEAVANCIHYHGPVFTTD